MHMVEEAEVMEGARAIGFALDTPGPSDFGVVDGLLIDRAFLDDRRNAALAITTIDELRRVGLSAGTSCRTSSPPRRSPARPEWSRKRSASLSTASTSTRIASS